MSLSSFMTVSDTVDSDRSDKRLFVSPNSAALSLCRIVVAQLMQIVSVYDTTIGAPVRAFKRLIENGEGGSQNRDV